MLAFQNFIATPTDIGVLFPPMKKEFLVRQPSSVLHGRILSGNAECKVLSPQDESVEEKDVLVRLPSLRESKSRITVLQQWIGRVERVEFNRFFAVLTDATNIRNPSEMIELDRSEVSNSDLSLLTEGATFYWSIGYRDSPDGQRERISTLRFARLPRINNASVKRIFEQADRLTTLLESE